MKFQNFCLILLTAFCLSIAAGNSKNGKSDGNNIKSGDTINIEGTIEAVSLRDSMIVFKTDKGLDSIFYNSKTKFSFGDPEKILRRDSKIEAEYVKIDKRKVALRIQPAATGKDTTKK